MLRRLLPVLVPATLTTVVAGKLAWDDGLDREEIEDLAILAGVAAAVSILAITLDRLLYRS